MSEKELLERIRAGKMLKDMFRESYELYQGHLRCGNADPYYALFKRVQAQIEQQINEARIELAELRGE